MTTIIVIILIVVLLVILGVQISKTSQLIDVIKGDKEDEVGNNKQLALIFASLGIFLFIYVVVSAYKNYHKFLPVSASEQGCMDRSSDEYYFDFDRCCMFNY
jgi:preprotein translocase subunit SecG